MRKLLYLWISNLLLILYLFFFLGRIGILHVGKTNDINISRESASLETIIAHLKRSYTGRIGYEFTAIPVLTSFNLPLLFLFSYLNLFSFFLSHIFFFSINCSFCLLTNYKKIIECIRAPMVCSLY